MEDRVGAYIIDSDGNAVPDLSDEAMASRVRAENLQPPQNPIPDPVGDKTRNKKKTEVNKDA